MTTFDDIITDTTVAELDPDGLEAIEIELVVLGMAGTTVRDDGVVERAFALAAERTGIGHEDALDYVRATMGQSKIEVFRALAETEDDAVLVNDAFEAAYAEIAAVEGVRAIDGAEALLRELRESGVKIALATGFSRATQDVLLDALGWRDLVGVVTGAHDALTLTDAGADVVLDSVANLPELLGLR